MRNRSLILLGIAVTCGLVASVGVTRTLTQRASMASSGAVEVASIVVAAKDIPMGDVITAEMLRTEPWPAEKIPSGAHRDPQNVLGRRPKTRIYAGTPILEKQLLGKGESAVDPTEHIPPGYRVVSVQVDEVIGAGRLIRPGDRVDLLVFIQRNLQRGIPETITRTVLQDVKVFAVGDQFDLQEAEGKRSITARSVSLLVTPRQAEILMLATQLGTIRLSLRSHVDDKVVELTGSSPRDLGAGPSEPPQLELPPPTLFPPLPQPLVAADKDQHCQDCEPADRWEVRLIEGSQVRHLKLVSQRGRNGSPTTDGDTPSLPVQLAWRLEEEAPSSPAPNDGLHLERQAADQRAVASTAVMPQELLPTAADDGPPPTDFAAP